MTSKKPYLPNNWKELKEAPSECFPTLSFQDFMDWKIGGWILPSSVYCLIRATSNSGKVKEYTYQSMSAAEKRIERLMEGEDIKEITVCDEEGIQLIRKEELQ